MDLNRLLAVVSVGGIGLLAGGAVVAGLAGWPPADSLGVSPVAVGVVGVLVGGGVVGGVVWGRGDTDRTAYWG